MQAPQIAVGQIIYFWEIFDLTKIFFFQVPKKKLGASCSKNNECLDEFGLACVSSTCGYLHLFNFFIYL